METKTRAYFEIHIHFHPFIHLSIGEHERIWHCLLEIEYFFLVMKGMTQMDFDLVFDLDFDSNLNLTNPITRMEFKWFLCKILVFFSLTEIQYVSFLDMIPKSWICCNINESWEIYLRFAWYLWCDIQLLGSKLASFSSLMWFFHTMNSQKS